MEAELHLAAGQLAALTEQEAQLARQSEILLQAEKADVEKLAEQEELLRQNQAENRRLEAKSAQLSSSWPPCRSWKRAIRDTLRVCAA